MVDTTGGTFHTRTRPAATIITGELTVEPFAGEQIFTPTLPAVHDVVVEDETVTVALAVLVESAPLVAVTWCVPVAAGAV